MKYLLRIFLIAIVLCSATFSWGQKVKYKDLFFLIHKSKKYDQGEPFLRSFLKNPKNINHANANFQMAVIYEINAKKKDVLRENVEKVSLMDSAVYFYSKSKSLMTEKEVKKNSEYYEDDYMRRDLRTGKMGIKASDIHIFLDKKVEDLTSQNVLLKSINNHFSKAKDQYQLAFDMYTALIAKFDTQRIFHLRSDDEVITECDQIKIAYDSAMGNFGEYKMKRVDIGEDDYSQSLNVLKIDDIKKSGEKKADFYATSIDVYGFDDWVTRVRKIVLDDIKPIKEKLIAFDSRLDKTREQLFTDSISVRSKLEIEKNDELYKQLVSFDSEAMPLKLLDLKQEEMKYWSYIFENKPNKDSSDIYYQIIMASNELEAIKAVDSLANGLLGYNLAIEIENYPEYINKQYEGMAGVQRYIKQKLDFAQEEKKYRTTVLEAKQERSRWLLYGNDSIPLFEMDSTLQLVSNEKTQYVKMGGSSSDNTIQFTYGIKYDALGNCEAYTSVVPDSLVVADIATYDMDKAAFTIDKFKDIAVQQVREDALKLTYVLYYDNSTYEEKAKKSRLTCVNSNGVILWSKQLDLVYPPETMTLYDKGAVAINYNVKYINTESSDKLVSRLLIGTDGKALN